MTQNPVGKIIALFLSTPEGKQEQTYLELDREGVIGDKFHAKDISRSVLISSLASYKLAQEHGIDVAFSTLGENILMDYNPYHLAPGDKLQIGEVILQISQNCTLCNSLSKVDKKLPKILKNDRGIFARVIQNGSVKQGDTIHLLT